MSFKEWEMALIDPDERKVIKLHSITGSPVSHFPDVSSFIDHLKTMPNARQCLILLAPAHRMKDLPSDIERKIHKLYIYGEKYEEEIQSFDDICLHLSNLIITQCTERSISFHRSNENGPARVYAQESITRSKIFIQQLQDLCDDIDEKVLPGQEENNSENLII
jgi:hypothetical protein